MNNLNITAMDCWAPGLAGATAWQQWAAGVAAPEGDTPPELPDIKPMQRRRLSLLARAVFKAAGTCLQQVDQRDNLICVFANAYGQCTATVKMLENIASAAPVSPTAFSISVHNAIAGQFSIAHQLQGPSNSLAPGRDGLGGVFIEVSGWLQQYPDAQVLLCCFEEPIPDTLRPYQQALPTPMAAAFLLSNPHAAPAAQSLRMSRSVAPVLAPSGDAYWQQILSFVAYLQQLDTDPDAALTLTSGAVEYQWRR